MTTILWATFSLYEVLHVINEERIHAIQSLGYGDAEARFLCLAALHSGYFVRRQFLAFVGAPKGWRDDAFTQKLIARKHCVATAFRHNHMVYRLSSKPFFATLDEHDNRNRREKQPATIKNKLMALDFVLEHQELSYVATEAEKIEYFTSGAHVPLENLPAKRYQSSRNGQSTLRYFVEKFPIFISMPGAEISTVSFCYVDEGVVSTDGFKTFFTHYQPLFSSLAGYRIVYVAAQPYLIEKARRIFNGHQRKDLTAPLDPLTRDLLNYFQDRRKYEARDFSGFDTARIVHYREQKQRFVGFGFDDLYRRWLEEGDAVVLGRNGQRATTSPSLSAPVAHFVAYLLRHNYDLFGTL